ncbi:glyoxalase/bleomycin resistance/extradiol dioxygenase family protein [Algoriphagus halophytocola]|uniref:Glyoxalase/bleomycin resistance/extradiol dioxygenase family protein n=1 Tax=Algoriphagus halophytocola TaxID=2991499 RepID=A0ABY6ME44_9BACT|nr:MULTISPECIES: glyoxalase/bleomycin resistance/extradiol dioxygenase family protein [unclassified Algoriphagus]UZD22062.1 glyoxalase/bleomycin resistance/extradiol dioxygenase family protein [Algoriphagus sp. TR-M5]WBL43313.1 glyoxalase/bleomycin resistance/extradiol dioxygenase family protein [Algoriphagus sp. TR-M9]
MKTTFIGAVPVLPSQDISRDLKWYEDKFGFVRTFGDHMYAGMRLEEVEVHLQWHADTPDDPLLGGSVVRIFVKNIEPYFESLVIKGILKPEKLRKNTPWGTHEFGLYDLNNNSIFIVEDIDSSAEKTS